MLAKDFDVVIVGAGVTGSAILIKLIDDAIENNLKNISIAVIDKNADFGPGLPFNIQQSAAVRMNTPVKGLNITLDNKHSYFDWLKKKDIEGDPEVKKLGINHLNSTIEDRFPSRNLYGKYLKDTVMEAIANADEYGITIEVLNNTSVKKINLNKKTWEIQLDDSSQFVANNLILATGNLPSEQYRHLLNTPNYFASPWQDLSAIDKSASVVVLGSGLSAIDTAKILVANGHTGEIIFASSSGGLPALKPPPNSVAIEFKYLTPKNLDKPDLTLEEVIELFKLDLERIVGKKIDLEKIMNKKQDPKKWLSKQIKDAEKNIINEWQIFLDEMYYHVLPYVVKNLSEKDLDTFKQKYYGPYMKWAAGMPTVNAMQMLELIENKQLNIVSDLRSVEYIKSENHFQINFNDKQAITTKYVINATGMGHNITDHPLLSQMEQDGIIKSPKLGGIMTNPTTYKVVNPLNPKESYNNLYAAGPIIFGSNPAVYAVESSAMAANVVVPALVQKLTNQKQNSAMMAHGLFANSVSMDVATEPKVLQCENTL